MRIIVSITALLLATSPALACDYNHQSASNSKSDTTTASQNGQSNSTSQQTKG